MNQNDHPVPAQKFVQFDHHGARVWAFSDLKGKHRQHCLCYACGAFKPGQPTNCSIAQENFELCRKHNLVLPVFECPAFSLRWQPAAGEQVLVYPADGRSEFQGRIQTIRETGAEVLYVVVDQDNQTEDFELFELRPVDRAE